MGILHMAVLIEPNPLSFIKLLWSIMNLLFYRTLVILVIQFGKASFPAASWRYFLVAYLLPSLYPAYLVFV